VYIPALAGDTARSDEKGSNKKLTKSKHGRGHCLNFSRKRKDLFSRCRMESQNLVPKKYKIEGTTNYQKRKKTCVKQISFTFEGDAEGVEEQTAEGRGNAKGHVADLPTIILDHTRQLLKRLCHQRHLYPLPRRTSVRLALPLPTKTRLHVYLC